MKKMQGGILVIVAVLALVSVASAGLLSQVQSCSQPAPDTVTALPIDTVNVTISGANAPVSYLRAYITASRTPELFPGSYAAWCLDCQDGIRFTSYEFVAYSSLDEASIVASGMPQAHWKKINYILNNKNADWRIMQAAMWHYDGDAAAVFPTHDTVTGYNHADYTAYISTIDSKGAAFVPGFGQNYAVLLYKKGVPTVIIERPQACPPCGNCGGVPEFPSLVLPVAMIIGLLGAVFCIRRTREH
jgi:hypothetical protein